MSILSALLSKRQAIQDGVDYLEQEVLGAILALVERIEVCWPFIDLGRADTNRMPMRSTKHTLGLRSSSRLSGVSSLL
jgi:hypothetical protein